MLCGDYSTTGSMTDVSSHVDDIPPRTVIDFATIQHGNELTEFLSEAKLSTL